MKDHTKCHTCLEKKGLFRLETGKGCVEVKFNGWKMEK